MPKFSIIIPVYNVAPYLRECLDSVLAQTFTDWEAICVDDGSTDESGAILDEYAAKDARFKVFHKENGGVGRARNCGIEYAKGEFILFLDADDAFARECLKVLREVLKQQDADIIKFRWKRVENHIKLDKFVDFQCPYQYLYYDLSKLDDAIKCFRDFAIGALLACGACYRTDLIKDIKFKSMPNGEDVVFGTEVLCKASSMLVITQELYYYLDRVGSAVNTASLRHLQGVVDTSIDVVEIVRKWRHYLPVKVYVFRKIRNLLVGTGWSVVGNLPNSDQKKGREILLAGLCHFYCNKDNIGALSYYIYKVILASPFWSVHYVCLRFPWEIRVTLLKNKVLKSLWSKIR